MILPRKWPGGRPPAGFENHSGCGIGLLLAPEGGILNACMGSAPHPSRPALARPVRLAAVHFPALSLECAFGERVAVEALRGATSGEGGEGALLEPDLARRLCAVRTEVRGRMVLAAVSLGARIRGVAPGMTQAEAQARLPELEVRDREPSAELVRLERAAELLLTFGPHVEVCPPSLLYVEIGRSRRVLAQRLGDGSERAIAEAMVRALGRAGHQVSVVVTKDPDTGRTLAQHLSLEWAERMAPLPEAATRRPAKRINRSGTGSKRGRLAPATEGSRADARGAASGAPARAREAPRGPEAAQRGSSREAPRSLEGSRVSSRSIEAPHGSEGLAEGTVSSEASEGAEVVPRTLVVPPGEELRALARLPMEALVWTDLFRDPDGAEREALHAALGGLRMLGVKSVAQLSRLPAAQVASRFDGVGVLLMERARASRERPLRTFSPPPRLAEALELDAGTEDLEPILFVLRRLFARLEARLEARREAVSGLRLNFTVEPGLHRGLDADAPRAASSRRREALELRFARPTRSAATMLSLARELLGGRLPGAVLAVRVEAASTSADRGAQLDLFHQRARRLEQVGELVGRLQAALGERAVFAPALLDTHRPEAAWRGVPFDVERALAEPPVPRPPRPAAPEVVRDVAATLGRRSGEALPEVTARLAVTGATTSEVLPAPAAAEARPWPKPVKRTAEDEPPPPLPPRPLELLETPEPATMLDPRGEPVLAWRGRRAAVVGLGGRERLEAEWWTPAPVLRDYAVAELADGRKLWLFTTPAGETYVHGIFD